MKFLLSFVATILLLFSDIAFATGEIICYDAVKKVSVRWEVAHIRGCPMIAPQININVNDTKVSILKNYIMGYYIHDGKLLLLALDDNFNEIVFELKNEQDNYLLIMNTPTIKGKFTVACDFG